MAELIVALALLGLVITLLLHTLTVHQKVFRNLQQRVLLSEQLRDGELALASDIRGSAVRADTLRLLTDTAFEFFSTIGSSVVCTLAAAQIITLVPAGTANGLTLTSLPLPPDTGDLLSVYSRIDSISGKRRWLRYRIAAVTTPTSATACPPATGFTSALDAQKPSYKIALVEPVNEIGSGAPVRILRRGRYSLYKSSEGEWYLGYKRCNAIAPGCSTIQPVSGPYLPFAANGGGMRFRYLDSFGIPVPPTRPLDIASIEVTLRGEIAARGRVNGRRIDSVVFVVAPRNLD